MHVAQKLCNLSKSIEKVAIKWWRIKYSHFVLSFAGGRQNADRRRPRRGDGKFLTSRRARSNYEDAVEFLNLILELSEQEKRIL